MCEELKFLINVVKVATKITEKQFDVKSKGDGHDLVTNLDLEIEEFLISEIKRNYPDFDIVSEEYNSNAKLTENCFIIDPIDGTINFANKLPLWGIQIACVRGGKIIASVINLPKLNELYYADETGAYLNGEKIFVNLVPIKNTLYVIDGKNSIDVMQKVRKHTYNKRNYGAVCVSMSFVASGKIHGAVCTSDTPWDYEPGLFISKMAGASVKSVDGFHAVAMNDEFLNILELECLEK